MPALALIMESEFRTAEIPGSRSLDFISDIKQNSVRAAQTCSQGSPAATSWRKFLGVRP